MIMAIMMSPQTKRIKHKDFQKWRSRLLQAQFLKRISPIIQASNGIVFGTQGVIIIVLSLEVHSGILIIHEKSCVIPFRWKYVGHDFDYSPCKIDFFLWSVTERKVKLGFYVLLNIVLKNPQ